ncbi:PGF-pre-PGF domain-containing protein [Methanococcoides sp. FTZ1]|uniref:PGF-pre-PGF domain-containing protein n=1 Tax=Methanococcoides sp. FTZ1 TaxID=3439061 RepID=UPI003F8650B5
MLATPFLFSASTPALASEMELSENSNVSSFKSGDSYISDISTDGRYILLKAARFNTEEVSSTAILSTMESTSLSTSGDYYIVQFKGTVKEEWKLDVRATGAIIYDYIPNNAFIIFMDTSVKTELYDLEFVQWIGPYLPSYRVSPHLSSLSDEYGKVDIVVMIFDPDDNERISAEISGFGGEVIDTSGDMIRARIDITSVPEIAALNGVSWIEQHLQPVILNDVAEGIINVSYVRDTHGLTGSGQIIGVADTGLDTGFNNGSMHDDLEGRIVGLVDWSDNGMGDYKLGFYFDGHGTHVAGSAVGNGSSSQGECKGMAHEAGLVFHAIENSDGSLNLSSTNIPLIFQQAYDLGARVHSNSWGNNNPSLYGAYTSYSEAVDQFMWEHPDFLILFSAGNSGAETNTTIPPGTAKNALTVGASESYRADKGPTADNIDEVAVFSSRGPTDDERIKPDVVAPGTWINSTASSLVFTDNYTFMSGTSMSTPITAGAAALVRQYYVQNESISPTAALLKATLINGAVDMGQSPDAQGWGRVNVLNSLYPEAPGRSYYHDNISLDENGSWNASYYLNNSSAVLKVTLVWTDHPKSPASEPALVNDLDLNVTGPDGTYSGNNGDHTNNVEQVEIVSPSEGWYVVTVSAYSIPNGPQPFALVLSGALNNDTTAPAINSIVLNSSTPDIGDPVLVTVNATDNVGVTNVIASGIELFSQGGNIWTGTFTALEGTHFINVSAIDAATNIVWNNSTSYIAVAPDTTFPVINSIVLNNITPYIGDPVLVTVNATDNVGVTNVIASGIEMFSQGGNIWTGTFTALEGTHFINVSAIDAATNIIWNNSTSYYGIMPEEDLPPGNITDLTVTSITTNSITISWSVSGDTYLTEIWRNNEHIVNVTGTTYTDQALSPNATYIYGLRPVDSIGNAGNWFNATVTTNEKQSTSDSSSSGGGGGGGGSGSTGETFDNIVFKDVKTKNIIGELSISYVFDDGQNPIRYINFSALRNSGRISTTIELLKNRSEMVDTNAPGIVYSNLNIWVGKSGFATEDNIADPVIGFRVAKDWLSGNGINESSIVIYRYTENRWQALDTREVGEDGSHFYFEAETPGFSPFAIVADVEDVAKAEDTISTEESKGIVNVSGTVTIDENSGEEASVTGPEETTDPGSNMVFIVIVIGIVLVLLSISYVLLSKGHHDK